MLVILHFLEVHQAVLALLHDLETVFLVEDEFLFLHLHSTPLAILQTLLAIVSMVQHVSLGEALFAELALYLLELAGNQVLLQSVFDLLSLASFVGTLHQLKLALFDVVLELFILEDLGTASLRVGALELQFLQHSIDERRSLGYAFLPHATNAFVFLSLGLDAVFAENPGTLITHLGQSEDVLAEWTDQILTYFVSVLQHHHVQRIKNFHVNFRTNI